MYLHLHVPSLTPLTFKIGGIIPEGIINIHGYICQKICEDKEMDSVYYELTKDQSPQEIPNLTIIATPVKLLSITIWDRDPELDGVTCIFWQNKYISELADIIHFNDGFFVNIPARESDFERHYKPAKVLDLDNTFI